MGFGAYDAPCGAVTAGSIAIGLKYGTSDAGDQATSANARKRSREWMEWFKYYRFGSINCFDLRGKPGSTMSHSLNYRIYPQHN